MFEALVPVLEKHISLPMEFLYNLKANLNSASYQIIFFSTYLILCIAKRTLIRLFNKVFCSMLISMKHKHHDVTIKKTLVQKANLLC